MYFQASLYLLLMLFRAVTGEFGGWGTSKYRLGRVSEELQPMKTASTSLLTVCFRMCHFETNCKSLQYNVSNRNYEERPPKAALTLSRFVITARGGLGQNPPPDKTPLLPKIPSGQNPFQQKPSSGQNPSSTKTPLSEIG